MVLLVNTKTPPLQVTAPLVPVPEVAPFPVIVLPVAVTAVPFRVVALIEVLPLTTKALLRFVKVLPLIVDVPLLEATPIGEVLLPVNVELLKVRLEVDAIAVPPASTAKEERVTFNCTMEALALVELILVLTLPVALNVTLSTLNACTVVLEMFNW
jgi:hypothetical protein